MSKLVFVSYSTEDTTVATTLRDHLEEREISCWMAPRDIMPGNDYGEQIIDAIEQAAVLVLILSENSNNSVFVRHEVERAVSKGKVIIPYRIQPVQPSRSLEFFISNYQWIDGWESPLAHSCDALVSSIRGHLQGAVARSSTRPSLLEAQPAVPNNVPRHLAAFVGREREVVALEQLLTQPGMRLITILGPGGMGKTRLSLAVAERHLSDSHFADGVYFLALASLSDAQHIVPTLMDVLSLSSQMSSGTPQQQLLDYLSNKEMLLIFDNFEHLLDGAEVVTDILQAAPQVKVVVTSRERLRVPGEQLFPLQGLDYSKAVHNDGAPASAAAQLFLQCARQLRPDFTLSDEDMAQVTRICRLVGGMPLGIELAAAWSELLTPAEIAAEIEQSLDFLEAERRGGQEHHRSVRAVFDSTWQRLDHTEQAVFARLSIFRGGFTREVAEHVAGASLRLLDRLTGKSLIQHVREHGRYTLHELLRQFAEEKLLTMPQAWDQVHDRHCSYYTSFLQRHEIDLKGSRQLTALTDIEVDLENIRLAWQWAVTHRKVEEIDHALESLDIFYLLKSWFNEGAASFRQAVISMHMDEPVGLQGIVYGKLLAKQGYMQERLRGEMQEQLSSEESITLMQKGLTILRRLGVRQATGSILVHLANEVGDDLLVDKLCQEAEAIFVETNDHWEMATLMEYLGSRANRRGEYERAKQYYWRGIALSKEHGMLWKLGNILNILGESHRALGEYAEAMDAALAGLAARQAVNDRRGVAYSRYLLGDLAWRMGDLEKAKQHSQESLADFQDLGMRWGGDFALHNLGNIACTEGRYAEAKSHFFAILAPRLAAGTLDSDRTADAFTGLASVFAAEGRTSEAIELLQLAIQNKKAWQETRERATKLLVELLPQMQEQDEIPVRTPEVVVAELLRERVTD